VRVNNVYRHEVQRDSERRNN